MRIIGGAHKGRAIHAPQGTIARPTTDRVRESLFNILEHGPSPPAGARVLDLFAGSGALGLEALSRGAAMALFVDENTGARGAIRQNIETLGLTGSTKVFRRDATKLGERPAGIQPFDLIFCDPPYRSGLGEIALARAAEGRWLAPGAIAVLERSGMEDAAPPAGFTVMDERRYGDTVLTLLEAHNDANNEAGSETKSEA